MTRWLVTYQEGYYLSVVVSDQATGYEPSHWVCLRYLHFAPENPEDGKMYLLVPVYPGCPGQSPESRRMVVCVVVSES